MSVLFNAVQLSIEISQLRQELADIPAHLREVEADFKSVDTIYKSKHQERSALETKKQQLEQAHRLEQEKLGEKEARLNSIKTEKEYRAVTTEITTGKTAFKEQERQIAQLKEKIAAYDEEIKPLEEKKAQLEQSLGEEKAKIEGSLSSREEQIKSLNLKLNEQLSKLPDDIKEKYHRIERQKQPPAALVEMGTCQACFISLPPQLYLEIQKGHALQTCPSCHRLLFLRHSDA